MRPLAIAFAASEVTPFAKTGGLADVAAGLPRHLGRVGHDVRVFLPLYRRVRAGGWPLTPSAMQQGIQVAFGAKTHVFDVLTTPLPDSETPGGGPVQVYLIDCPSLYDRDDVYAADGDEHVRFALLTRELQDAAATAEQVRAPHHLVVRESSR